MNKTHLIEQLKKPEDKINSLLNAAVIAADLEDYTEEHLKTLQGINEIMESGKAKTYKAAAELHRKQQESDSKSEQEEQLSNHFEQYIQEHGGKAAEANLAALPAMAEAEYSHLKSMFIKAYRKRIAELLQDPGYRQQFEAAIEGQSMGKLPLLNSTTSNIVLPSSSSSSS